MAKIGATAAFRGFRLQTLYILARLIDVEDQDLLFRPEGKEDLDTYTSDGQLLETVQVKAYSANLTLSNLTSEPNDSFFDRSLRNRADFPNSTIRIVSFGPVGPEMEQAWSSNGRERKSVHRKLTEDGYTQQAIADLLSIQLDKVDEAELERKVFAFLQTTLTGGDPPNAFDLLMYWVCRVSERREQISYSDVIDKLTSVGRYLEARSAYYDEWFTSILPLTDTLDSAEVDPQRLAQEFEQGVDARFEHILAGLDAVRSEKLAEIQRKFESSNVVIVHGASGQGKSTLAFRYLHEYTPNVWRFFVRSLEDRKHIRRVANALSGHAKATDLPCIVYIDVSPSDQEWPILVRELSHLSKFNVLVTIREEDWRRATGYRAHFESEELELTFDREEADNLYAQLKEHNPHYLGFDEAWEGFGGTGPLLEFVYFLTQKETLKRRIESQIRNLQDRVRERNLDVNELHLLRLVAVASAYEAKLDLKALVERLRLSEPARTIELFTKEYLIRVDESGSTVTGLHAVRSNIMLESLLDDVLSSWESVGVECLPLLVETDLEIFLLHAFSRRRTEATALLEEVGNSYPKSWIGVAGILRALLWLGVDDYTESNRTLIDEVIRERGPSWYLILDSDLTEIAPDAISNFWYNLPELDGKDRLLEYVESVRAKQVPKDQAFVHARDWLQNLDMTRIAPSIPQEFVGLAEVLFWLNHLRISQDFLPICEKIDFERIVEELPIDTLADLIYALHFALGDRFDSVFQVHRTRVESRFKRETKTFSLEDDGETVRANFIPDSAYAISRGDHVDEDAETSTLHEETMYRVDLLRKLLPNRQKYGSKGYGHRLGILSPGHDETEKSIDVSNFYPQWAQRINVHFRTLGNYPYRPDDWEEHARQILGLRQKLLAWLIQLRRASNTFFRRETRVKLYGGLLSESEWKRCEQLTKSRPLLPKGTADEWGFVDESLAQTASGDSGDMDVSKLYEQSPALTKHKAYIDVLHKYLSHLSNFMTQGLHVIVLNPNLGRAAAGTEEEILRIASENGIKADQERLSTWNLHDSFVALKQLQIEFRNRFSRFIPAADLDRLEKEENRLIRELWPVWYQFAHYPTKIEQNAAKEFAKERDETLKRVMRGVRQRLKAIKHDGFSAREARTELHYKGESIPCVLIDINNPSMYWLAVQAIIAALQQELHTDSNKNLRYYVIKFWLTHFAVVPLICGRALSQSSFVFPTFALQSGSVLEKVHMFIPNEVSDEDWAKLDIPLWEREKFEPAVRFTESVATLSIITAQAGDLSRFSDCVEYDANGVIERFVKLNSEALGKHLQKLLDICVELADYHDISQIDVEERPSLIAALELLEQTYSDILPTEDYVNGAELSVSNIRDWSERLEQVRIQAEILKLLWITDVLDHGGTET